MMGIHLIDRVSRGVEKFVCLGTICAYPKFAPVPFREEDLWNGYPEETNAPYGIAKKALLVRPAYREQYGFNAVFLFPVNLYGPRDNFDLEYSHVIPALMRKFIEAQERGDREVVLWGDGTPTREFLYVDDRRGHRARHRTLRRSEPVNLGTGNEISIRELAEPIAAHVGYRARSSGTPQAQRPAAATLDVSRAEQLFQFRAATPLRTGIERTVAWYRAVAPTYAGG